MFAIRYFCNRFFPGRFFPHAGENVPTPTAGRCICLIAGPQRYNLSGDPQRYNLKTFPGCEC